MAPEVLEVLIGRVPDMIQPAFIEHYDRWKVRDHVFPGLTPCSSLVAWTSGKSAHSKIVRGTLLNGLTSSEQDVFDWFEGDEYSLEDIRVWVPQEIHHTISEDEYLDGKPTTTNSIDTNVWKYEKAKAYIWDNPIEELELTAWSYEHFREKHLSEYLKYTVIPCRRELDELDIGKVSSTKS